MAKTKIQIVLEAIDEMTEPLRNVGAKLVGLKHDASGLTEELKKTSAAMGRMERISQLTAEVEKDKNAFEEAAREIDRFTAELKSGGQAAEVASSKITELKNRQNELTEAVKKSEAAIKRETKALQEQGYAIDDYGALQNKRNSIEQEMSRKKADEQKRRRSRDQYTEAQSILAEGMALGYAGINVIGNAYAPVAEAKDLQTVINEVIAKGLFEELDTLSTDAISSISADLTTQAKRVSMQVPSASAIDVANLQVIAATGGLSPKGQITDDFLKTILNFASFDKMDPNEAFKMLDQVRSVKAMRDPKYNDINTISEISDVAAYTALRSKMDTFDLQAVYDRAVGAGAPLGMDERQIGSLAIALADKGGLYGARSGTAITRLITALTDPADETKEMLDKFGFDFTDPDDPKKMMKWPQIFAQIGRRTKNWGEEAKTQFLGQLGTRGGLSALAVLSQLAETDEGVAELQKIELEFDKVGGATQKVADRMKEGLGPAIDSLSVSWKNLKSSLGDSALKDVEIGVRKLTFAFSWLGELFDKNPLLAKTALWGTLAVGVGLLGAAIVVVVGAFALLTTAVIGLIGWVPIAIGAVVGVVAVIATAVSAYWDEIMGFWDGIVEWLSDIPQMIRGIFVDIFGSFGDFIFNIVGGIVNGVWAIIQAIGEPIFSSLQYWSNLILTTFKPIKDLMGSAITWPEIASISPTDGKNNLNSSPIDEKDFLAYQASRNASQTLSQNFSYSAPINITVHGPVDPKVLAKELEEKQKQNNFEFVEAWKVRTGP